MQVWVSLCGHHISVHNLSDPRVAEIVKYKTEQSMSLLSSIPAWKIVRFRDLVSIISENDDDDDDDASASGDKHIFRISTSSWISKGTRYYGNLDLSFSVPDKISLRSAAHSLLGVCSVLTPRAGSGSTTSDCRCRRCRSE